MTTITKRRGGRVRTKAPLCKRGIHGFKSHPRFFKCSCSSTDSSSGFLNRRLKVRILPGALENAPIAVPYIGKRISFWRSYARIPKRQRGLSVKQVANAFAGSNPAPCTRLCGLTVSRFLGIEDVVRVIATVLSTVRIPVPMSYRKRWGFDSPQRHPAPIVQR